jgi:hypothetical protein
MNQMYDLYLNIMNSEELYENLLTLVERSEARIDKTNKMIQALSRTCDKNMDMYDRHITALEASRDLAQENAARSIGISENLTSLLNGLRCDYQSQLTALKAELHTLKGEYRDEMEEMRSDYRKLTASYTRLAERGTEGAKAEITISS